MEAKGSEALGSFTSDSGSEVFTRGWEGQWGLGGVSETQESVCIYGNFSKPLALNFSPICSLSIMGLPSAYGMSSVPSFLYTFPV